MNLFKYTLHKANQPWTKKDSERMARLIEKSKKYYNKERKKLNN